MTNKYCSKKVYTELVECGFTIIELLIVIAIVGVLMPLGINSFVNTRRSREVSGAAANARDAIKSARAKALSVSLSEGSTDWPVAYEVEFSGNNIITRIKSISGDAQHSLWSTSASYNDSEISNLDLGNVSILSYDCERVVFSSVNGNMHVYNASGAEFFTDCLVVFSSGGKTRALKLNPTAKTFEIQ